MWAGRPGGPHSASHESAEKPGIATSATVGTSGMRGLRAWLVIARIRIWPCDA